MPTALVESLLSCPAQPPRRTALDYGSLSVQAEELFHRGRWDECGLAFDELLALRPHAREATEYVYAALLCRINALGMTPTATERGTATQQRRELSAAERDLLLAMRRYECMQPGDDADYVMYRHGRMLYEAGHLAEAAAMFGELLARHPSSDLIFYAANLRLDALNRLEQLRGDGVCGAALRAAAEEIDRGVCRSSEENEEVCATVARLLCELRPPRGGGAARSTRGSPQCDAAHGAVDAEAAE